MQDAGNAPRQDYRVYLYNEDGSIGLARDVEASSDEEACALGLALLRQHPRYAATEVWQRARQVCRHTA